MEVVDMILGQRGFNFPNLMYPFVIFGQNSFFLVFWFILFVKFLGIILTSSEDVVVPANERFFLLAAEILIKRCSFLQHYIIDY